MAPIGRDGERVSPPSACPQEQPVDVRAPRCLHTRTLHPRILAPSAFAPVSNVSQPGISGLPRIVAAVGAVQRAPEVAADAEPTERERLLDAFPQRAGGAGVGAVEFAGELAELVERTSSVVERPRSPQFAA
jgi:hypothetical protein